MDRAPSLLPAASEHHRLVFVDGHHRADLSSVGRLPEGAELTTLRALLAHEPAWVERHLVAVSGAASDDRDQPLLALNTAMMMNGFVRSEEHTSELQSLMRSSYAVFCLKKKNKNSSETNQHRE